MTAEPSKEHGKVDKVVSPDQPVLTTTSLEALQTAEQRALMDLIDQLRRAGLSSVLQLPQIVVCGDQSSGKSSVLEAITEIPFPRKESLCTRFATEIILRQSMESSIVCKINPDGGRSEDEQRQLRNFARSIEDFAELPRLIEDATVAMGLDEHKAFGKDVLSIEICGPSRPQLTLVDLPGLIHAANKSQSDEDVELIKSLVEEYVSEKRTIILAVISAKNDYANQVILKTCRRFDQKGVRTLGIITKPDYLRQDSENERAWLDLALNRDIYFELGWHLLKNRADDEQHLSFAQRNDKERVFLDSGNYKALPPVMKGIDSLRNRLSQLLFSHLRRELPTLREELDNMARNVCAQLQAIGKSRASLSDQQFFLADLFSSAYGIAVMGVTGNYEHVFFGHVDISAPFDKKDKIMRLRAVIQQLNIEFARRMHRLGHKYYIKNGSDASPEAVCDAEDDADIRCDSPLKKPPQSMSREQAITRVVEILKRSRGREIPGTFNPMLINELFREQSAAWVGLAQDHVDRVAAVCKAFLLHVLDHVAAPDVRSRIRNLTVLPALKAACGAALDELKRIEQDKQRQPITYNHYFTDTLQKIQHERYTARIKQLASQATVSTSARNHGEQISIDPKKLSQVIHQVIEQDMDKFSAEQALDAHDAYFKAERKYFIDVIAKQVIERHLVVNLAEVFSIKALARYSDKDIHFLASEPYETVQLRDHLESKRKMLEEGQEAFRLAMEQSF